MDCAPWSCLCYKTSASMFVIMRLSSIVDLDVLHTAHYGLLYPFLTHGIAGSGHGCKNIQGKVFILQKSS
jgi:hypothetical protein